MTPIPATIVVPFAFSSTVELLVPERLADLKPSPIDDERREELRIASWVTSEGPRTLIAFITADDLTDLGCVVLQREGRAARAWDLAEALDLRPKAMLEDLVMTGTVQQLRAIALKVL